MIETLKRLSPVPIEFVYPKVGVIGEYFWGDDKTTPFLNKRIEVDKTLKKHEHIAVLSHEIAHALCDVKNCNCRESKILEEIHAHKYSLNLLLKHEQKASLKWLLMKIEEHLNCSHFSPAIEAAKHIMKLKLWQKCLDYVK